MPRDFGNLSLPPFERALIAEATAQAAGWKKIEAVEHYADPHVQIEVARYETPGRDSPTPPWTICHRKAAIAVAGQTAEGQWVMVEQERYPLQRSLWEFPAGQIDDLENGLDTQVILDVILSELEEEVGYTVDPEIGKITPMGYVFSSQGFSDEHMYLFHATPLVPFAAGPRPESGESIAGARLLTTEELCTRMAEGQSIDALSLALYARLAARGLL